jgi:hypothetical protein
MAEKDSTRIRCRCASVHDREPPIDPADTVPGHADVTMEINLDLGLSPTWIDFTARPK